MTPPFKVNPAGTATCSVVNVSAATRQIAIDVYFLDGSSRTDIRAAGEVYENAAVGLNTVAAIVAVE